MLKLVTIIGARPQFIKAAAVSRAIAGHNSMIPDRKTAITEIIVHTGQHFDAKMSDIFFEEMQIPLPDYNLNINSVGHGAMTGRMLEKIEEVLLKEKPDYVLVYGDTNSTLAGALAARKLHTKVVHVEAGLRSFNMRMPEEVNRVLSDRISDILCCPTKRAVENLLNEGYKLPSDPEFRPNDPKIMVTGDVMHDVAIFYSVHSADKSKIVDNLCLRDKEFVLLTIHRAENTDDPARLSSIVHAVNRISNEITVVLPLHPRTRKILNSSQVNLNFPPMEPVGYFDMVELMKRARLVMTDSGGVQKEAYFFKKPCITLRDETEWTELVECGFNFLSGADEDRIIAGYRRAIGMSFDFSSDLYGNGRASETILSILLDDILQSKK